VNTYVTKGSIAQFHYCSTLLHNNMRSQTPLVFRLRPYTSRSASFVIAKGSALGSQTHPAPPLRSGTCLNQAVFFTNGSITSNKKSLQ
jgi:hypothetical protein